MVRKKITHHENVFAMKLMGKEKTKNGSNSKIMILYGKKDGEFPSRWTVIWLRSDVVRETYC